MADITSRPFHPSPAHACSACVFGRGPHEPWCERAPAIHHAFGFDIQPDPKVAPGTVQFVTDGIVIAEIRNLGNPPYTLPPPETH